MNSIKTIENRAFQLIEMYNGEQLPINVTKIAKALGLEVIKHDLGDNISGVLYIDKGKGIIGYNPEEPEVRRRFTIAHELGHYNLHRLNNEIFVDQKMFKAVFRDQDSSTGEIKQEREANAFAAALLMPKNLLKKEIANSNFDLSNGEDDVINNLAKTFRVSTQAMAYRIANLGLF